MRRFLPLQLLALALVAESAMAEPTSNTESTSNIDLWTGLRLRPLTLSLAPAVGSDIAPGPPNDIVAAAFVDPVFYQGPKLLAAEPLPLQLRIELAPVFGITPFATTTFAANPLARIPSTDVGAAYTAGPLQMGTRFYLWRDDSGLWLNNAMFVRYVAPVFDVGLESRTDTALNGAAEGQPAVRRAVNVSAAVHPTPEAPTVRVNTSLLPAAGHGFSSVSAFGRF
jgi:hypothetical protein